MPESVFSFVTSADDAGVEFRFSLEKRDSSARYI
jgi:hypothetical protein